MGWVKELPFDWDISDEEQAWQRHRAEARALEEADRENREKVWAAKHPVEWREWVRLRRLNPVIDLGFDFDDFLGEVGKRPPSCRRVGRRNKRLPHQQGNLKWLRRKPKRAEDDPLNAEQAARLLGVGRSTVYEMLKSGELVGFTVRGRRVFDRKALERYKQDHTNEPRRTEQPTPLPSPARQKRNTPQPAASLALRPPPSLLATARRSSP